MGTRQSQAMLAKASPSSASHGSWLKTMTTTVASRRVLERCGRQYVRTLHLDSPDVIKETELGHVENEIARFRLGPDSP